MSAFTTQSLARAPVSMARNYLLCGQGRNAGSWMNAQSDFLPTVLPLIAVRRQTKMHQQALGARSDGMDTTVTPVRLTGSQALRWGWRFARDPLIATRRSLDAFGPFVMLSEALPFIRPARAVMLGVPLVWTAGSTFYRELLSDPDKW